MFGGDLVGDDTENTAAAFMGSSRIAVLAQNLTNGDVNGELISSCTGLSVTATMISRMEVRFPPSFMQGNGGNDTLEWRHFERHH